LKTWPKELLGYIQLASLPSQMR